MAIYTRTGDKGRTSLFNGQRVLKSDLRVEAYGTIDELNSAIGVVLSQISNLKAELIKIQNDLLDIGSSLANPSLISHLSFLISRAKDFERFIDQMTAQMPALKNFILPGGGKTGAMLHLVRAISRRAERRVIELNNKAKIDKNIIVYMNRLSDLLFTMARFANFKEKKKETIWTKKI